MGQRRGRKQNLEGRRRCKEQEVGKDEGGKRVEEEGGWRAEAEGIRRRR
jgi:hypothetical protein